MDDKDFYEKLNAPGTGIPGTEKLSMIRKP